MAIERVKAYFAQHGMEHRVQEFTVSSATVELAAQALGCEGCRIAKCDKVLDWWGLPHSEYINNKGECLWQKL